MNNMIEVNDLTLSIRGTEILKHINLSLEQGKVYGFIGRNGSGKTMLMKCICGFILPSSGTVTVAGQRIGKDVDFPSSVGIMIETPGFLPYLSGWRNLKRLADLNRKASTEDIRTAMCSVGLDPDLKRTVRHYSLGMRQRLGIAQAIMENPDFLVLDEPFNGLDEEGVVAIRALLQQMNKAGKTILLSSHNAEDIEILCHHVFHMDHGNMTQLR